ncbi:hypothetical protein [Leifsonia sp. NPDC058248]
MDADANRIAFETRIGVVVEGETWSCVEIPDSDEVQVTVTKRQ